MNRLADGFIAIDMDPTAQGSQEQLIEYFHAEGPTRVLANGISEWLSWFAEALESGEYDALAHSWSRRSPTEKRSS